MLLYVAKHWSARFGPGVPQPMAGLAADPNILHLPVRSQLLPSALSDAAAYQQTTSPTTLRCFNPTWKK
jgi:hypothetical protein